MHDSLLFANTSTANLLFSLLNSLWLVLVTSIGDAIGSNLDFLRMLEQLLLIARLQTLQVFESAINLQVLFSFPASD